MVPGFQIEFSISSYSSSSGAPRVALAGPWDDPPPRDAGGKQCGSLYSNTKCVPPALLCQNCRNCYGGGQGPHEECAFWYPCGVCFSTEGW
jgi:hypothetical protein